MQKLELQIVPEHSALVIIDVQMDYFRGGRFPLWRAGRALRRCQELLAWARDRDLLVCHVQHFSLQPDARFLGIGTAGTDLHPSLAVRTDELVIPKHWPNSFRETSLEQNLRERGISTVVWTGMITWMCVDTTVRAAYDLGFRNILASDATAAGPLLRNSVAWPGIIWPWRSQAAFLAALGAVHATVCSSQSIIRQT